MKRVVLLTGHNRDYGYGEEGELAPLILHH
jgi:hypothetical protein